MTPPETRSGGGTEIEPRGLSHLIRKARSFFYDDTNGALRFSLSSFLTTRISRTYLRVIDRSTREDVLIVILSNHHSVAT